MCSYSNLLYVKNMFEYEMKVLCEICLNVFKYDMSHDMIVISVEYIVPYRID